MQKQHLSRLPKWLSVSLLAITLSSTASAATLTTTGSFGSFNQQTFFSYQDGEDPSSSNLHITSQAISGLQKFDPTLGTLTGATISAVFDYEIRTSVYVDEFISPDGSEPHSASFHVDSGSGDGENAYVYIRYQETPSTFRLVTPEAFQPGASCGSPNSFEPCSNFPPADFVSYGSSADLLTPPESGFVDSNDLVGTGSIDTFAMAIYMPEGSVWTTENVFIAEGEVFVDVFAGSISIEYEFTPVPLPAAAWLFGSALVGIGTIARRKPKKT